MFLVLPAVRVSYSVHDDTAVPTLEVRTSWVGDYSSAKQRNKSQHPDRTSWLGGLYFNECGIVLRALVGMLCSFVSYRRSFSCATP